MVDYRLGWLSTYTLKPRAGLLPGEAIVRARQLIDTASFGPDALKVIGQAFDAAWAEIAGGVGTDPDAIEAARLKLAHVVLLVASEDSRDVEALKRAALKAMARSSRP